ncbi:hypothetical protein ACHQM5_022762 [Ranunculus cassubicifolius]
MQDEKKMKVKKGCIAVRVGVDDGEAGFQRFVIPISYLYNPLFQRLLEKAKETYGYHTTGALKLPCSIDDFLRWRIERENASGRQYHHGGGSSLSIIRAC